MTTTPLNASKLLNTSKLLGRRQCRRFAPYLLLLPTVVLLAVFIFGMINGVLQGFGFAPFINRYDFTLDYYAQAFSEPELLNSILYSLYLAAASTIGATLFAILLSAAICSRKRQRALRLFGTQLPIMVSHSVVVFAMIALLSGSGLVARVLFALGLVTEPADMVSITGAASGWGIILVYLWREIPYIAFCTVTIMANIADSYGEAAASLGASPLKAFFTVTLPLCKSAIIKAALIVFTYVFGAYEVAALLGPSLPQPLPVLAYYKFKAVDITNRCYAMALDGITVALCLAVTAVYFYILYRERKARLWQSQDAGD